MNHYEGMFILHNRELPEEEQAEPVDVVKALFDKVGCQHAHSAVWANRKLSFPIKGNQTGTYVLAYFSCEPAKIAALRRSVAINDRFLREMVFAVDVLPEGAADALRAAQATPAAFRLLVRDLQSVPAGVAWTTSGHTAVDVGLYAFGAGAALFHGRMGNDAVGQALFEALGL